VLAGVPAGAGSIRGTAFSDADANGQLNEGDSAFAQLDVSLSTANTVLRSTRTADDGTFAFEGVAPGQYRVSVAVPLDHVSTTDAGVDVDLEPGADVSDLRFGIISAQAAGLVPGTDALDAESDDEQIIALASVSSLPLRRGRHLARLVVEYRRWPDLARGAVPLADRRRQASTWTAARASLTMVLAGFGLEVGPSQVRDYLNNLIDNYNTDLGTSLDALSRISREAGLTPMDLYSDGGGYRNWSTDAVRWHVQQGHPVITLVKYRNLPGHSRSLSEFDHYIVISGLTPNGFIYNDAAFATTLGYGLEISDVELEYAWDNSSIPHNALALGLAPDAGALSFLELPRRRAVVDRRPRRAPPAAWPSRTSWNAPRCCDARADRFIRRRGRRPGHAVASNADQWSSDPDFDVQPDLLTAAPWADHGAVHQSRSASSAGPGAMVPNSGTSRRRLLWAVADRRPPEVSYSAAFDQATRDQTLNRIPARRRPRRRRLCLPGVPALLGGGLLPASSS
jgi:hypothetical protein